MILHLVVTLHQVSRQTFGKVMLLVEAPKQYDPSGGVRGIPRGFAGTPLSDIPAALSSLLPRTHWRDSALAMRHVGLGVDGVEGNPGAVVLAHSSGA